MAHVLGNARAVVANAELKAIVQAAAADVQLRLKIALQLDALLIQSLEGIGEHVQKGAADVLGHYLDGANLLVEIDAQGCIEVRVLRPHGMVGQFHVLFQQRVEIDLSPVSRPGTGVLQHAAHDAVGSGAVLPDLVQIDLEVVENLLDLLCQVEFLIVLRLVDDFANLVNQLRGNLREVLDEVQGVLDLVSDPSGKLAQGRQLLLGNDLLLGPLQLLQGLFQCLVFGIELLGQLLNEVQPLDLQGVAAEDLQRIGHVGDFVIAGHANGNLQVAAGHFPH